MENDTSGIKEVGPFSSPQLVSLNIQFSGNLIPPTPNYARTENNEYEERQKGRWKLNRNE